MSGSKVTGVLSHSNVKGISSIRKFGLVLLMFLRVGSLSIMKPRYKLIDTFMLLMYDTGARFWRLSRCGSLSADQCQLPVRIKFHRRSSRLHPTMSSVSRRRLDSESSSLDDELASISSGGRSIYGSGHIICVSFCLSQTYGSDITLKVRCMYQITNAYLSVLETSVWYMYHDTNWYQNVPIITTH